MVPEILNYKASFLNPALKLIVPILLLWGTWYLYKARNTYQGELGKVVRRLAIVGAVGCLSGFFRFSADIWFSSMKWGESLFGLAFGIANIYAAWPLLTFLRRMAFAPKPTKIEKVHSTGVKA